MSVRQATTPDYTLTIKRYRWYLPAFWTATATIGIGDGGIQFKTSNFWIYRPREGMEAEYVTIKPKGESWSEDQLVLRCIGEWL